MALLNMFISRTIKRGSQNKDFVLNWLDGSVDKDSY